MCVCVRSCVLVCVAFPGVLACVVFVSVSAYFRRKQNTASRNKSGHSQTHRHCRPIGNVRNARVNAPNTSLKHATMFSTNAVPPRHRTQKGLIVSRPSTHTAHRKTHQCKSRIAVERSRSQIPKTRGTSDRTAPPPLCSGHADVNELNVVVDDSHAEPMAAFPHCYANAPRCAALCTEWPPREWSVHEVLTTVRTRSIEQHRADRDIYLPKMQC